MRTAGKHLLGRLARRHGTTILNRQDGWRRPSSFVSNTLDAWACRSRFHLEFSRPGTPTDDAFAESFSGHFRAECLDRHWSASLEETWQAVEA